MCVLKVFQRLLGLMAVADSVIFLGPALYAATFGSKPVFHPMPGTASCQSRPPLYQSCGTLGNLLPVSMDASNSSMGALLEGNPPFGSWSALEQRLHINYLEMLAVFLTLKTFLPALKGHYILVRSESMTVVAQSPRWSQVTHSLQDGSSLPFLGTEKNSYHYRRFMCRAD